MGKRVAFDQAGKRPPGTGPWPRKPRPTEADAPPTPALVLSTSRGPALRRSDVEGVRSAWLLDAASLLESEGTRSATATWDWRLFERAYVEGVLDDDGKRCMPSLNDLARWSGATHKLIQARSAKEKWTDKRAVHEERIPEIVREVVRREVGERIGTYLVAADAAVAETSAREWVRRIAEPYLERFAARLRGELEADEHIAKPSPNAGDAEKLLKLLMLIDGEATERVATVSVVQANINLQARATVEALQLASGRGLIEEDALPKILAIVEESVARVPWSYRAA